jgi:hypothetical protein
MNKASFNEFCKFAERFRGQRCWSAQAGTIGSMFYLNLGQKRNEPSYVRGELVIAGGCVEWRIDDRLSQRVLATSEDDNSEGGPIVKTMKRLEGTTIRNILIEQPGLDCTIEFDNGLALKMFPVVVEPYDNYSLWHNEDVFEVGPRSLLTRLRTSESVDYRESNSNEQLWLKPW